VKLGCFANPHGSSYDAGREADHRMKRWPIITAGVAGAVIGFLGTVYVGMAMGLATSLTTTATVILVGVCPVIYAI